MSCQNCRHFVRCLEWECFKEGGCEFYEPLEGLKPEELDEIDRNFARIYEMNFERFKKLVENISDFGENAVVMQSLEVWRRVIELRRAERQVIGGGMTGRDDKKNL